MKISLSKLQHIYDRHAIDFGMTGVKDKGQLEALRQSLERHLKDPETKRF